MVANEGRQKCHYYGKANFFSQFVGGFCRSVARKTGDFVENTSSMPW